MLCDELKEYTNPTYGSPYYDIDEVDAAIAELKDKIQMHDFFWEGCGFAKRGFKNTITVSEAFDRLEAENAELKQKLEDAKATAYAESVDSGMRERRLRRELWLTRAMRAHREKSWSGYVEYVHFHENSFYEFDGDVIVRRDNRNNDSFREWNRRWVSVERKCRAKAEEYK